MGGSKVKVDHENACKGKKGRRARKEEGEDGSLLGTGEDERIKGGEREDASVTADRRSGRGKKELRKADAN
jgi:hypothetical protein